jgi:GTPase involved in cell partitioning and DNA repair
MTDDEVQDLMDSLTAYRYKYKGKNNPNQIGVMAQDLERGGSNAVVDTPAGKMVQKPEMMQEVLAMLAHTNKRLMKLEGKK